MENLSLHQLFAMDKESRIRSVEEVSRGLACDCICPSCGAPVIARQGSVREWHFAHAAGNDCNGGMETALHLAAKQLLLESGGLTVPETKVEREVCLVDGRVGKGGAYRPERWVSFLTVEAEKTVGTVRPDVVAVVGEKMLFIEIAVTHFVGEEKQSILSSHEVAALEIDLSAYPVVVNKDVASLHAASFNNSGSARSGLSQTSSFNFQFLVAPDQRSGQRCLAAS